MGRLILKRNGLFAFLATFKIKVNEVEYRLSSNDKIELELSGSVNIRAENAWCSSKTYSTSLSEGSKEVLYFQTNTIYEKVTILGLLLFMLANIFSIPFLEYLGLCLALVLLYGFSFGRKSYLIILKKTD